MAEWIGGDIERGNRSLRVSLSADAATGVVFPLVADPHGACASVDSWEQRPDHPEVSPFLSPFSWRAIGGSCRTVCRTRSHSGVELVGVTMAPENRALHFGRGRFRIDGIVRR